MFIVVVRMWQCNGLTVLNNCVLSGTPRHFWNYDITTNQPANMICKIWGHQSGAAKLWKIQVLQEVVQHDMAIIVVNFWRKLCNMTWQTQWWISEGSCATWHGNYSGEFLKEVVQHDMVNTVVNFWRQLATWLGEHSGEVQKEVVQHDMAIIVVNFWRKLCNMTWWTQWWSSEGSCATWHGKHSGEFLKEVVQHYAVITVVNFWRKLRNMTWWTQWWISEGSCAKWCGEHSGEFLKEDSAFMFTVKQADTWTVSKSAVTASSLTLCTVRDRLLYGASTD